MIRPFFLPPARLRTAWVAALLALPGAVLSAHEDHAHETWKPTAYPDADAHAPRPLPDRVVLTWTADPARSQTVSWRTDTTVERALAEVAIAGENGRDLKPRTVAASTERFSSDLGVCHQHQATFADLLPDTLYAYRVGDGLNWTEWFHFRTASLEARPFSFVYFGDAQNDLKTHWSRVFREAFRDAPRAAFTLHAGDLINRANRDVEWGEWMGAPGWVNATVPIVATPGNHEYFNDGAGPEAERRWKTKAGADLAVTVQREPIKDAAGQTLGYQLTAQTASGAVATVRLSPDETVEAVDDAFQTLTGFSGEDVRGRTLEKQPLNDRIANPGVRTLSRHWRPQFAFPEADLPEPLKETVYHLDYQGVRIISLNSNVLQKEQVPWLRQVLSNNPQRWTIVTFHHPIFSPARNRDNPALRALWKPLFDEFKVDLVLTGHDHTYARTGDITHKVGSQNVMEGAPAAYDPSIGTVYVVSVSGPKMYDITNDSFAVRTAEDTQLYQVVQVSPEEIRYEARTAVGRLYDAFVLRKPAAGAPNQLIEVLPPERRRPRTGKEE